jgi:hypothetical protein
MAKKLYAIHAMSIDWAESQVALSEEVVETVAEIGQAVERALAVEGCGHVEVVDNEYGTWEKAHPFWTKKEMDKEMDDATEAWWAEEEAKKAADPLSWVDDVRQPY